MTKIINYARRNVVQLGKVSEEDSDHFRSFDIRCPGCNTDIATIDCQEIGRFSARCRSCDTYLYPQNTVAVSANLQFWKDYEEDIEVAQHNFNVMAADHLRKVLIDSWEMDLSKGIEFACGEYEGSTRTVDATEVMAEEFEYFAEQFGWEWEWDG